MNINPFAALNREEKVTIENSTKLEALKKRIESELVPQYMLGRKEPKGEVTKTGFSFKLNLMNLFPIVPFVEAQCISSSDGTCINASIRYESLAKKTQKVWFGFSLVWVVLWALGSLLEFARHGIIVPITVNGETGHFINIVLLSGPIILGFLTVFVFLPMWLREKIWQKPKISFIKF